MACIPETKLCANIGKILSYSEKNVALQNAPHFLYNCILTKKADCRTVVVFGLNPGESKSDWVPNDRLLKQETCCEDFHGSQRPTLPWTRKCLEYCGAEANIVQTEAFFWSSPRWNDACFLRRYGFDAKDDTGRRHLKFCAQLNLELLDFYNPVLIVCPGIGAIDILPKLYGLEKNADLVMCPDKPTHRLMQEYKDRSDRVWLITKHWSGARGFTSAQKDMIKKNIDKLILQTEALRAP